MSDPRRDPGASNVHTTVDRTTERTVERSGSSTIYFVLGGIVALLAVLWFVFSDPAPTDDATAPATTSETAPAATTTPDTATPAPDATVTPDTATPAPDATAPAPDATAPATPAPAN